MLRIVLFLLSLLSVRFVSECGIFGGFFVFFFALIFEEAGFDTPAKLVAWCPSV